MGAKDDQTDATRRSELLLALTTEHSTLQTARATTVSESASRSSLYLTTVSSAVVALALVAQVSKLGQAFFIFSLAILPVLFALGLITYGRLLQSGSEDVIYARSISRIRTYYAEVDPSHAGYFHESSVDLVGLRALGLFSRRWQQFLAAAATVLIVNAVVGGVFTALMIADLLALPLWLATVIGAMATVALAVAGLVHQWRAWSRVEALLSASVSPT